MNRNRIRGSWKECVGKLREKWDQLTEDDLKAIDGKRTRLAAKLQERYGYEKYLAYKELDKFERALK